MQPPDEQFQQHGTARVPVGEAAIAAYQPGVARASFLDFFGGEYAQVIAFLMQCGATRQDAEDATQEAFIAAWQHVKQPGAWERIYQPSCWIRTIALRKYYRRPGFGADVRSFSVAEITDDMAHDRRVDHGELTVQAEFVRSILRDLDPATRAVMAFHIDGFRSVDIAHHLDMTPQNVRDLVKKGRKVLKNAESLLALGGQDWRRAQ